MSRGVHLLNFRGEPTVTGHCSLRKQEGEEEGGEGEGREDHWMEMLYIIGLGLWCMENHTHCHTSYHTQCHTSYHTSFTGLSIVLRRRVMLTP